MRIAKSTPYHEKKFKRFHDGAKIYVEKGMSQPKFVITADGFLRLGMVNMHKDLLLPGDECKEGGYYQRIILSDIRLFVSEKRPIPLIV